MNLVCLIRSMGYGGAERQLVVLSKGLRSRGHSVTVAVMYPGGPLEAELREAGVSVVSLEKRGRWDLGGFLIRLIQLYRIARPDAVYSFLSEANLFALGAKILCPSVRLVWGARGSHLDFSRYEWVDFLSFRLNCLLARFVDAVIVNSHSGLQFHLRHGYPAQKTFCIPNGVDTDRFRLNRASGEQFRSQWGVCGGQKLVGLVGRLDPMKDHPVFLEAAALVAKHREDVKFVCVGEGTSTYKETLRSLAVRLGIDTRLTWAGELEDMGGVYNALDLLVSSSYGEGMPNVIAEAMACGVPCVVTDVGDSAWLVGAYGEVVNPRRPNDLARAMRRILDRAGAMPEQIRGCILERLAVRTLTIKTEQVLDAVIRREGFTVRDQSMGSERSNEHPESITDSSKSLVRQN